MHRVRKMTVALLVLVTLAVVAGVIARRAMADAMTYSSQFTIPAAGQTIPYTADPAGQCYGEDINLTNGDTLIRSQGTMDQNGFHGTFDVVRQGISGVGAQTGDRYQVTGTDTASQLQSVNGVFTTNFEDHINIIGQGPDNNAVLSSVLTLTWDANGQVTATQSNFSLSCH